MSQSEHRDRFRNPQKSKCGRGVPKRVSITLWIEAGGYAYLKNQISLPLPKETTFFDGRIAYALLTAAGFPHLAYALFSQDVPLDDIEELLSSIREVNIVYDHLRNREYERKDYYFDFTYDHNLLLFLKGEIEGFTQWADELKPENLEKILEHVLAELENQPIHDRPLEVQNLENCLENLRNLALQLTWLTDEKARYFCLLRVSIAPLISEQGLA